MKIAFVSDVVYPWVLGGVESIEYQEMKELAKINEVHVFCMRFGNMGREFVKDGIHYHANPKADENSFYKNGKRSAKEAARFSMALKGMFKYKFDVVQANMFPVMHIPVVKLYCRLNKAKLILDVAEVWDKGYWKNYMGNIKGELAYRYNVKGIISADFYIANSTITEKELLKLGIDKRRIEVFSPFLDRGLLGSIKAATKHKTVIVSGRLIREKRIDSFIRIMKQVIDKVPNAKGIIIGNGPEKESLESMIKSYGIEKSVIIRKPYKEKRSLYRAIRSASLMLQMSGREGLSAITIESIALGTPVILPSYTPIPEEVKEMCNVMDEKEIPDFIIGMFKKESVKAKIRNKGNLERYYTSGIMKRYAGIFKNVGLR